MRWFSCLRRIAAVVLLVFVVVLAVWGGRRPAAARFAQFALPVAALIALLHRLPLRGVRRLGPTADVLVTNLAAVILLSELGLRLLGAAGVAPVLIAARYADNLLQPGRDYGDGLIGNRLGYPGPELPLPRSRERYRIAALGDSFAVGPAVAYADNYLILLERRLPGCELGNFGVSGAGPGEYRAILRRDGWRCQPDAVLLSIFVGNDVHDTLPDPGWFEPRAYALGRLGQRSLRMLRERGQPPASRRSRGGLAPDTFRAIEARRLVVCQTPTPDFLEQRWRLALEHLVGLVHDCRQQAVPLAVVLIPDEFQVNPAVRAQALADARLALKQFDRTRPQRRLLAFFAQQGIPCLDLLPAFDDVPDTYEPCDTHWNRAGNHLAADRIARWLRDELDWGSDPSPVPPPPARTTSAGGDHAHADTGKDRHSDQ